MNVIQHRREKKKRFSKQDEKQHLFFFFTPSRHGRRVRGEARMKVRSARRKRKAGKRDVHMPKLSLILCLEARSLQMLKTASANEVHFCQTRGGNGKECVGGSRIILSLCETARWPLTVAARERRRQDSSECDWIVRIPSRRRLSSDLTERSVDGSAHYARGSRKRSSRTRERVAHAPSRSMRFRKMEGMQERERE